VKVNTTFNAFLLENSPSLASHLKPLTMVRHLSLEDDTKEYWGFYLLQGSSVTVSTCVRYWRFASNAVHY
jgi:peptidyl-prolyl cis-trans isomerase SDCCAG10